MYSNSPNTQTTPSVRQKEAKAGEAATNNFVKYLSYLYVLGGFVSLIANLTKSDANLVIFTFLFVASIYMPNQKIYGVYILLFSLIVDVFWLIFVQIKVFSSDEYYQLAPWEGTLRLWTLWTTVTNMAIKVVVAVGLIFCDHSLRSQAATV